MLPNASDTHFLHVPQTIVVTWSLISSSSDFPSAISFKELSFLCSNLGGFLHSKESRKIEANQIFEGALMDFPFFPYWSESSLLVLGGSEHVVGCRP